jgi:hypothetical protein
MGEQVFTIKSEVVGKPSVVSDDLVRFEVFTAMTMKDAVFWDVAPDGGDTVLRNVGEQNIYTAPHPRRQHSSVFCSSFEQKICETALHNFRTFV